MDKKEKIEAAENEEDVNEEDINEEALEMLTGNGGENDE